MTHLVIVRHAESAYNCENRIQGHRDSGLSAKGRRQARLLGLRIFKKHRIERIYSSDLGRAFATTAAIAAHHPAIKVIRDPALREINLGDWEGMTPDEVDHAHRQGYQRWLRKPSACVIPNGEPIRAFRKRVTERVRRIARLNRGRTVLLVTHGGVITALLADWLKADFDCVLLNLRVDNTGVTLADETDTRVRLHAINDISHLGPRDR